MSNEEQQPRTTIESLLVINNKTDMKYTYESKEAPFGLSFGYAQDGLLVINRLFSEDGKSFEGVARLSDFSIINIKFKP